jgi:hypothetical protein
MAWLIEHHFRWRPIASTVALSAACGGSGSDPADKRGDLDNGNFRYICVGNSDVHCDDNQQAASFPQSFAVGGRFGLAFEPDDTSLSLNVRPASRTAIQKVADVFIPQHQGFLSVIAVDGNGTVIDTTDLNVRGIERLSLEMPGFDVQLSVGEATVFRVTPWDAYDRKLVGSVDYQWESSDPSVFEVTSDVTDNDVELTGRAIGTASLQIAAGAYTEIFTVEVDSEPVDSDTATTADSDASSGGTDSATDSDSGTDSATDSDSATDTESATDSSTDTGSTGSTSTGTGG